MLLKTWRHHTVHEMSFLSGVNQNTRSSGGVGNDNYKCVDCQ